MRRLRYRVVGLGTTTMVFQLLAGLLSASAAQVTTATTSCSVWGNRINCQSVSQAEQDFWTSFTEGLQAGAAVRAARAPSDAAALDHARQEAERRNENAQRLRDLVSEWLADAATEDGLTDTLPTVNQHLVLEFGALDGAEISYVEKIEGGHFRIHRRIALTRDLSGATLLEVSSTARGYESHGLRQLHVLTNRWRTLWLMTPANNFSHVLSREPLTPYAGDMFAAILVQGRRYLSAMPDGVQRGVAPPGLIPEPMARAVIAAIPGQLPDTLSFWVLAYEQKRPMELRFRVTERTAMRIPIASPGQTCVGDSPRVQHANLEVVRATITVGTVLEERVFLADHPHLHFKVGPDSPDQVKCLLTPRAVSQQPVR